MQGLYHTKNARDCKAAVVVTLALVFSSRT